MLNIFVTHSGHCANTSGTLLLTLYPMSSTTIRPFLPSRVSLDEDCEPPQVSHRKHYNFFAPPNTDCGIAECALI